MAEAISRGETVIVPSRQRAHAIRMASAHHALAQGRTVWPSPDVLPFDAWILREVERAAALGHTPRVLSAAEEWWLWREAVAQATQDTVLVNASSLADGLRRADRLADDYGINIGRWLAIGGAGTRLLDAVRRNVRHACRDLGADTALNIARGIPDLGGVRPVHFAGFHAPRVPQVRALHATRSARALPGEWWLPGAPIATPAVEQASDEADEIERVAAWCLDGLQATPASRLLVVAAGSLQWREAMATRLRAALAPRSKLAGTIDADLVAIEGGMPLARQALVHHALGSLTWLVDGLEFEDFSTWLLSPYGPLSREASARLDLWWRRRAPLEADARASLARLAGAAQDGIESANALAGKARAALTAMGTGPASAQEWSERFSAALEALQPEDKATYGSAEQQTLLRFVALLDEFGGVSRVTGHFEAGQALRALRELAARTTWQPATGDARVTIASAHDDPIVRYDGVWVAGLTADAWPASSLPDPFIPLPALREAGVPTIDTGAQLAAARASLEAWQAAAEALVLSTPTASGDTLLAPSPLLLAWPRRAASPHAIGWPPRKRRELALEVIEDFTGRAWPAREPLPGGTRSIELQAACPFRAHAELQLGATALDAPVPGIAPDERGRWLHRALELLWRRIGDSEQLGTLPVTALHEWVAHAVAEARETELGPPNAVAMASRDREERRLGQLMTSFVELERTRPPFRIAALEEERQVPLGAARLAVRMDRIDALGEGGLAVIDYKSGKATPQDWFGERPNAVQLLIYLAALGDEVRALALARVAPPAPRFQGVAIEAGLLPRVRGIGTFGDETALHAWSRQLATWQGQMQGLAAEFLAAHATVTPVKGACQYCHLAALCRVGERAKPEAEEGADD